MRVSPQHQGPGPGDYLRVWRKRRRKSQLELALDAEISQRHLSFLESGRSSPSREMVLHLAEQLDVPLRERNAMLLSAGFAPVFTEFNLDNPAMSTARHAVELVLTGHEPFPALAIDRHWNLVMANSAIGRLLADVEDETLLASPINVLRLSLHPRGLAPHIENLAEWRVHLLDRLRRQITATRDPVLAELLEELSAFPGSAKHQSTATIPTDQGGIFVPLTLVTKDGVLSFLSTTTVFGTPRDIVLAELAIEAFFPANAQTRKILEHLPHRDQLAS